MYSWTNQTLFFLSCHENIPIPKCIFCLPAEDGRRFFGQAQTGSAVRRCERLWLTRQKVHLNHLLIRFLFDLSWRILGDFEDQKRSVEVYTNAGDYCCIKIRNTVIFHDSTVNKSKPFRFGFGKNLDHRFRPFLGPTALNNSLRKGLDPQTFSREYCHFFPGALRFWCVSPLSKAGTGLLDVRRKDVAVHPVDVVCVFLAAQLKI